MSANPNRIVDAHVHFWDPSQASWYPYLVGQSDIGMGDVTGMARRFDLGTYQSEVGSHPVVGWVNIAAATGNFSVDETLALDARASREGHPDALIGGLVPGRSLADVIDALDQQGAATRFRGVRPMGQWDSAVPAPEVLTALEERGLLFELMAHPDQLLAAAEALAAAGDLVVVVEHTGWPRNDSQEEFTLWRKGMAALARLGPQVHCKLSGLAMPLHGMDPKAFAPWVETAIELFGPERCVVGSNFPVDGLHGTLQELFTTMIRVLSGLSQPAIDAVFAENAERLYRCSAS